MLRGFATTRALPMDPELALGAAHGLPSRRTAAQRRLDAAEAQQQLNHTTSAASSFGRALLSFCLVLLVLGVLPATFVVWACLVVLVITFLRVRRQAQHLHQSVEQHEETARRSGRLQFGAHGGPVVRVIPGGGLLVLHTDPQAALERLNLQLRHLDEEMGYPGEDAMLLHNPHAAAAAGSGGFGGRPPPLTDADIAALPCYSYKAPRGAAPADAGQPGSESVSTASAATAASNYGEAGSARSPKPLSSPGPSQQLTSPSTAASGGTGKESSVAVGRSDSSGRGSSSPSSQVGAGGSGGDAARPSRGSADGCSAGTGHGGLTCPVCLDAVAEGSTVMTLPCLHQFHASCITPWLRQNGIHATCPMCKTPVFR